MPLPESYENLVAKAEELEKEHPAEAAEIFHRILNRLGRLSRETLEKRMDLGDLAIRVGVRGNYLYRRVGNFDAAQEVAEQLGRLRPRLRHEAEALKAYALADAGRLDEAMELLQKTAESSEADDDLKLRLAAEALWHARPDAGLALLDGVIAEEVTEDNREILSDAWYLRSRAMIQAGRAEEAEQSFLESKRLSEDDPPSTRELVDAFISWGDLDKALQYADMDPNMAGRGLLRGIVAALKGKQEWARDEWWRVTREPFDADDDEGLAAWLECALRQGDTDKASAAIQAAREKHGVTPRLLLFFMIVRAQEGEVVEAADGMRMLARVHKELRPARIRLVRDSDRLLIEQAAPDPEARQALIEALFSDPSEVEPADEELPADAEPAEEPDTKESP